MNEAEPRDDNGIKLSYTFSEDALPLWTLDEIPSGIITPANISTIALLIHEIATNDEVLTQFPEGMQHTIQLLNSTDIVRNEPLHQLPPAVALLNIPATTHGVIFESPFFVNTLKILSLFGHEYVTNENQTVSNAFQALLQTADTNTPRRIDTVSLNGRVLPIGEHVVIRAGSEWQYKKREVTLTNELIPIMTIPTDGEVDFDHLYHLGELFFNNASRTYIPPEESYIDLIQYLAYDASDTIHDYFAHFERYITRIYMENEYTMAFIRWAESDEKTFPIAIELRKRLEKSMQNELTNMVDTPIARDNISILNAFSHHALPLLEIPTHMGRATGDISLDDHMNMLAHTQGFARSDEQWQEEIASLLWHPMNS